MTVKKCMVLCTGFRWALALGSHLGLHPFSPRDELGVASSFFGHSIDESCAGALSNAEGETP